MTKDNQIIAFKKLCRDALQVMMNKGNDYANEDALSNFKNAGNIINLSAQKQCLSLISTKVARLGNLIDNKTPKNESISDNILDLFNYVALLYMIQNEDNF